MKLNTLKLFSGLLLIACLMWFAMADESKSMIDIAIRLGIGLIALAIDFILITYVSVKEEEIENSRIYQKRIRD
jgi:hypothetical protein